MPVDLEIIRKEAIPVVRFTFTDSNDDPVNMTGATFTFVIRPTAGSSHLMVEKGDASFDKTSIAVGVVSAPLSVTDTDYRGRFDSELRTYVAVNDIQKNRFVIDIAETLTD